MTGSSMQESIFTEDLSEQASRKLEIEQDEQLPEISVDKALDYENHGLKLDEKRAR